MSDEMEELGSYVHAAAGQGGVVVVYLEGDELHVSMTMEPEHVARIKAATEQAMGSGNVLDVDGDEAFAAIREGREPTPMDPSDE